MKKREKIRTELTENMTWTIDNNNISSKSPIVQNTYTVDYNK